MDFVMNHAPDVFGWLILQHMRTWLWLWKVQGELYVQMAYERHLWLCVMESRDRTKAHMRDGIAVERILCRECHVVEGK